MFTLLFFETSSRVLIVTTWLLLYEIGNICTAAGNGHLNYDSVVAHEPTQRFRKQNQVHVAIFWKHRHMC